jgi:CubicO group peptidase (beta-lactamase class C family)
VAACAAQVDSLARAGAFAGAAMLDKSGVTLFARVHGMASRPLHARNTLETRFNLGSLNKIFTHVAIEQLAQAGKLRLEDPVTRYLPDYKVANADRITLRMLLEHRGGVPDVLNAPDLEKDPGHVRTSAAWYALVREMPLRFEPGTRQQYSNGGFVLLGAVISAVSGEDYYDYVRKHIYEPAGMTLSDHYARDERIENLAVGYTRAGDPHDPGVGADTLAGLTPDTAHLPGRGSAAGGGYSTVGDLVRFANALRAGKLLDAAHVRDVFGEKFALGIAGGSPGVNGLFIVAGPYTLAVLANLDPPAAEQLAPTLGRMVRRAAGVPPPAPR